MNKTLKVEKALRKAALTAGQIASRFDVPNVRAMIYDLKRKNLKVKKQEATNTREARWSIAA